MIRCEHCNCLCDPVDLIGGVCDDCREEERNEEIRKEWNRMMRAMHIAEQQDGQYVICQ